MRYSKKLNMYRGHNVTFNTATYQATSYDWWRFVDRRKGFVIFNSFSYGRAFQKHHDDVREVLNKLGIKVDIEINCPVGLQDILAVMDYYNKQIELLYKEKHKKGSRSRKNLARDQLIEHYRKVLDQLRPAVEGPLEVAYGR